MQSNLFCSAIAILKRTSVHSCCVTADKVLPCLWPYWSGRSCRCPGLTENLLKPPRCHTALSAMASEPIYTYPSHQPCFLDPSLGIFLPRMTTVPWLWPCTQVWAAVGTCKYELTLGPILWPTHHTVWRLRCGGSFTKPWVLPQLSLTDLMDNRELQRPFPLKSGVTVRTSIAQ